MTETPARPLSASAVIIGAGIVGNSLVHHLALLGWRDLVLVDKGPMPNPGGSTGHASNFIFPIEYSKMMFELTEDSTAQYEGARRVHAERRHRGGPHPGADDRAEAAVQPGQGLGHPGRAGHPGRGEQAGAVPGRVGHPGRRALPHRRRGRLAAGGHADAGERAEGRGAHRPGRRRGARYRGRRRPGAVGDHQHGRDRDRQRGHLLRGLVAADRPDGRRPARAHPDRAPDDQRRPDRAVRRHTRRDLLPDRP